MLRYNCAGGDGRRDELTRRRHTRLSAGVMRMNCEFVPADDAHVLSWSFRLVLRREELRSPLPKSESGIDNRQLARSRRGAEPAVKTDLSARARRPGRIRATPVPHTQAASRKPQARPQAALRLRAHSSQLRAPRASPVRGGGAGYNPGHRGAAIWHSHGRA